MLRIGTRASPLALWQAEWVQARLAEHGQPALLEPFETRGDRVLDVTLSKIGSKGVFTQELEDALLDGRIHLAVHSAKDMPSRLPEGLEICAYTKRTQPHDALVSFDETVSMDALAKPNAPDGTPWRIGTSSTRRQAMLARHYPHVTVHEARGNLQTRLRKLGEGAYHALILAQAGVERIGQSALIRALLPLDVFTPPVGQGSLAIEVCTDLDSTLKTQLRAALNHPTTERCLLAERAYLATVEGGCSIPAFAYANLPAGADGPVHIRAGIVSPDGAERIEADAQGQDPIAIGRQAAQTVLAGGGEAILAALGRR